MGLQFSRCLDEQVCGREPPELVENNFEEKVAIKIVKPSSEEEEEIEQQFNVALETKALPKSEIEDEKPTWTADSIGLSPSTGDTSSNQSVISTISPTKDVNARRTPLSLRSPKSYKSLPTFSPIRRDSWLQLEQPAFNLTPIAVKKPMKGLALHQPYLNEIISIHDIKNAILFNDLETLKCCPSKEYMFTKYHFHDFRSQQALHLAVLSNEPAMVQYILTFSPNIEEVDADGYTALDLARKIDNQDIIKLLQPPTGEKQSVAPINQMEIEATSPFSPFPESSVIASSYQESVDGGVTQVKRAMSDFSVRFDNNIYTPQHPQSDVTEQESRTLSNSSASRVPPYKRIFPRRVRKAAKQFIHFIGH